MSPELGITIILALFWGPTGLWLAYRVLRGHRRTNPIELFPSASAHGGNSQLVPAELSSLGEPDGPWVCRTCRSLNRRGANRCYSCRMAKDGAGRHAADELPVSPGVPVMAASIARSSTSCPSAPASRSWPRASPDPPTSCPSAPASRSWPRASPDPPARLAERSWHRPPRGTPRRGPTSSSLPSMSVSLVGPRHPLARPCVPFSGCGMIPPRGTTTRTSRTAATQHRSAHPGRRPSPRGSSPVSAARSNHSKSAQSTKDPAV